MHDLTDSSVTAALRVIDALQAQGYEVKQGKFISFRAPGQERFTRCKTLGEDYTEERITQRIKGIAIDLSLIHISEPTRH